MIERVGDIYKVERVGCEMLAQVLSFDIENTRALVIAEFGKKTVVDLGKRIDADELDGIRGCLETKC